MTIPILICFHERFTDQVHAAPALILAQSISYRSNWRYRKLLINILCLNTDNPPMSLLLLHLATITLLPHGGIFLLNLFPRVQYKINILCHRKHVALLLAIFQQYLPIEVTS